MKKAKPIAPTALLAHFKMHQGPIVALCAVPVPTPTRVVMQCAQPVQKDSTSQNQLRPTVTCVRKGPTVARRGTPLAHFVLQDPTVMFLVLLRHPNVDLALQGRSTLPVEQHTAFPVDQEPTIRNQEEQANQAVAPVKLVTIAAHQIPQSHNFARRVLIVHREVPLQNNAIISTHHQKVPVNVISRGNSGFC